MAENIHGHEVLRILLSSAEPLTRERLSAQVVERFGPDARFHTCGARDLSLDGLLAFLSSRGKVTETGGTLTAHREQLCDDIRG